MNSRSSLYNAPAKFKKGLRQRIDSVRFRRGGGWARGGGSEFRGDFPQSREEKSVHNHHRKKIFWTTFLASKKNFPRRWRIQKNLIKTRKAISTTEIFPLWTPFFSAKKSSALEQGGVYAFFFPAIRSTGSTMSFSMMSSWASSRSKPESAPQHQIQLSAAAFWGFSRGGFPENACIGGQFLKEISVRFAGEKPLRTQKNTKQSSAQRFLNDPFPKTPFFSCWNCKSWFSGA